MTYPQPVGCTLDIIMPIAIQQELIKHVNLFMQYNFDALLRAAPFRVPLAIQNSTDLAGSSDQPSNCKERQRRRGRVE